MNRLLFTTAILALSTGLASAEVALSGDARMGIISDFGADDISFTHRIRVSFALSGESDSGFTFGATFRPNNAEDADEGIAGSTFVSGGFGKLSMGDLDGAAQAAVGHVSGVGLTGLGDLHEIDYIGDAGGGGSDPSILYEYSTGPIAAFFSSQNPAVDGYRYAVGVKYSMDKVTIATGYESFDTGLGGNHIEQWIIGAAGTFGPVTAKAVYAQADYLLGSKQELAVSLDYSVDALVLTGFAHDTSGISDESSYGLGASYDLGGGAKVIGGYVDNTYGSSWDMGLSFTF